MNKRCSTFERKMENAQFKKAHEKSYRNLLFSELLLAVREGDSQSVKKLIKEVNRAAFQRD